MPSIFPTVLPVFALILLGWIFHRNKFPSQEFWAASEKLTYFVLIPALFISGFSGRQFNASYADLAITIVISITLVSVALVGLQFVFRFNGPTFTSIFQGGIRPNIYIAFPLCAALLGPDWLTLMAVASLAMTPLVNTLSVFALSTYGNDNCNLPQALLQVAKTPPIIACLIGMSLSWYEIPLPLAVDNFLSIIAKAAFPIGLLTVGAGLRFSGLKKHTKPIIFAAVVHLFALPIVTMIIADIFGLTGASRDTALLFSAVPVAPSSYILARQLGGDDEAMALIITTQVVLSAVTLPFMLEVLGR